ncbi:MAG TPA: DUF3618 domain-containing protein [Mycobacterium sp.]|nr:DUF3618 domain-containing protein [Mycobacterium sp.]
MAKRDPDIIKQDIDRTREQLASTVDTLVERANPRHVADRVKARAIAFAKLPAVVVSVAGLGAISVVVVVRKVRNRIRYR